MIVPAPAHALRSERALRRAAAAPIPYGDLPTGGGTWSNGGNLTFTGGNLLFSADNSRDIGASGATRPRNIFVGTSIVAAAGSVGTPSYRFTTTANTGLFEPATDTIGMTVGQVEKARLTATEFRLLTALDFRSSGNVRRCGWNSPADHTLRWFDGSGSDRLEFKWTDGQPLIGLMDDDWQLALGNPTNSGYVLLNGTNNSGTEDGCVLITGNTNAAAGHVKIRAWNGISATVNAVFKSNGNFGVQVADPLYPLQVRRAGGGGSLGISVDNVYSLDRGALYYAISDGTIDRTGHVFYTRDATTTDVARVVIASDGITVNNSAGTEPTGGRKGAGTINLAGDVYKNNTTYNNPDYVFEVAYEGRARSPAPAGYEARSLEQVEAYTREHLHLPGIARAASGIFERADMLLEKVEELYLHAFDLNRRLNAVEEENRLLKKQVSRLTGTTVPA